MQRYVAALTMVLLLGMVLARSVMMNRQGIRAVHFGNIDRKDFLILPFALLYLYMIFSNALNLPPLSTQQFFHSEAVSWIGVFLCLVGVVLFLWSLLSFGRSFRVGIDTDRPDKLVTTGVFAFSRNPIYVAFLTVLVGQFLIFPNWILLVYLAAGAGLFHRQVLREEAYLKGHYGSEYSNYTARVRRYF
jgi:protein-S-isoprenylcysteine O-methyltransferase Ste14